MRSVRNAGSQEFIGMGGNYAVVISTKRPLRVGSLSDSTVGVLVNLFYLSRRTIEFGRQEHRNGFLAAA